MVVAGVDLFVLRQLRQRFLGWRVWISGGNERERERYHHTVWGRRIEDSNEMNMALWEKQSDWRTDLAMAHFEYVNCPLFPWALTTYTYTFNFPKLLIINAYRAAYNKYKVKDPLVWQGFKSPEESRILWRNYKFCHDAIIVSCKIFHRKTCRKRENKEKCKYNSQIARYNEERVKHAHARRTLSHSLSLSKHFCFIK